MGNGKKTKRLAVNGNHLKKGVPLTTGRKYRIVANRSMRYPSVSVGRIHVEAGATQYPSVSVGRIHVEAGATQYPSVSVGRILVTENP